MLVYDGEKVDGEYEEIAKNPKTIKVFNKADIKNELQYFKENGIRLKVLDLPTTMIEYPAGQEWVLEMVNNILILQFLLE